MNYYYNGFSKLFKEFMDQQTEQSVHDFCVNNNYSPNLIDNLISGEALIPKNKRFFLDLFEHFQLSGKNNEPGYNSEPAIELIRSAIYAHIPRDLLDLHLHISNKLEMEI